MNMKGSEKSGLKNLVTFTRDSQSGSHPATHLFTFTLPGAGSASMSKAFGRTSDEEEAPAARPVDKESEDDTQVWSPRLSSGRDQRSRRSEGRIW